MHFYCQDHVFSVSYLGGPLFALSGGCYIDKAEATQHKLSNEGPKIAVYVITFKSVNNWIGCKRFIIVKYTMAFGIKRLVSMDG